MSTFYDVDLAYIHHAGFTDLARSAGEVTLARLRAAGIDSGTVVDLGCGSGVWANMLTTAGFDAVGFDVSAPMLDLARRNAPAAEFHRASLYEAPIPACRAVTAFGEGLNYRTDDAPIETLLAGLYHRIAAGLGNDGLFVFDVLLQTGEPPLRYRTWNAGDDWAVMVDVDEDPGAGILHRDITLFRESAHGYRRSHERHVLNVPEPALLESLLAEAGFHFEVAVSYGEHRLGDRRRAYVARVP